MELTLAVQMYGLMYASPFSALLYPLMSVTATLKKPDGTVIWQRTEATGTLAAENKEGYEFAQYVQNPKLIQTVFANAAGIVSRLLITDLGSRPKA